MRDAAAAALGLDAGARSRSPRPARSACRCRSTPCSPGSARPRRRSRADGGDDFARGDHDHRPLARSAARVRAGGVTLSAQAKGAGMIEPGFATMLCFVQTDAVVDDPEAALRAAVAASFERITVDGQMSTNDTVLLQATGAAGAPLPEGLLDAVLLQLALEIVADGEGATRVGRIEVERRRRGRRGRAGRPRDRQLAAGQDGALRPRPELGPDRPGGRDGAGRRGARGARRRPHRRRRARRRGRAEAEIALRLGRGEHARPRLLLATSATSTSGSTRSTRPERPSERPRAPTSRPCSRRSPTSGSSTAARW